MEDLWINIRKYRELLIRIDHVCRHQFKVRLQHGEFAEEGNFEIDLTSKDVEKAIASVNLVNQPVRRRVSHEYVDSIREIGGRLFNYLFDGRLLVFLNRAREVAESEHEGLRVLLEMDDTRPEVVSLPWEFLYDGQNFMCLAYCSPIVRRTPHTLSSRVLLLGSSYLRMLVVAEDELDIADELDDIKKLAFEYPNLEVKVLQNASYEEYCEAVTKEFEILQYISHKKELQDAMYDDNVLGLLQSNGSLRLIYLNVCSSSLLACKLASICPGVVGMHGTLSTTLRRTFSKRLITGILNAEPLEAAVTGGRRQMDLEMPGTREWGLPVFYLHTSDGVLVKQPHEMTAAESRNIAASKSDIAVTGSDKQEIDDIKTSYQQALDAYKRLPGKKPTGPDDASVADNLAALYHAQGRYAEAEPLYQRALGIREKVLGPDHPDVATSLNNLAALYHAQGRYAEAEPLYQRALGIREKFLNPEHPDVAESLNNLAALYRTQGHYAEAEPLYQRAWVIREKVLGPEHPLVGQSLNNLAALYHPQGRYAEAEPLYQRALAIREKVLGPDHPDVATSLNNLALVYEAQGRYAEAEPLYQRALATYEKALGPDHPDVATSLNNLAGFYQVEGRYAEAEPLYQRALATYEKALGPDHPDVATSLNNLALVYEAQGRYTEAEPLYEKALEICKRALGEKHPEVVAILGNLGELYRTQGRLDESEARLLQSLTLGEKALGPTDPTVMGAVDRLQKLYGDQGEQGRTKLLELYRLKIAQTNLRELKGQSSRAGAQTLLAEQITNASIEIRQIIKRLTTAVA